MKRALWIIGYSVSALLAVALAGFFGLVSSADCIAVPTVPLAVRPCSSLENSTPSPADA